MEDMFYGHSVNYWIELERQAKKNPDCFEISDLISQNGNLRAKVSYYEDMFDRLQVYRSKTP